MEKLTTIAKVASGTVDLVWNGVFASVQFNADCTDVLHLCHGMCCTRRAGFVVELEENEKGGRYFSVPHPTRPGVEILRSKNDGSRCIYQDDAKCTIYQDRPKMCRQWHCSPEGQKLDTEIERRDAGWMLLPVRSEEAEFVQLRRDNG